MNRYTHKQVSAWFKRHGFVPPSRATLYRWMADGYFPRPKKICNQVRWTEKSLERWLKKELT